MRIGLLLLSGDPIQVAHLGLATYCLNNDLVDVVKIVPAKGNPWKNPPVGTFEERVEMIRKCCLYIDRCDVDDIEKDVMYPYSCYVLEAIRDKYGTNNEYFLIGGADTISSLPEWLHYEDMIKGKFKVIGFTRDGQAPEINEVDYTLVESDDFSGISSTLVRNLISAGKTAFPYVPDCILEDCYRIYSDPQRVVDFEV